MAKLAMTNLIDSTEITPETAQTFRKLADYVAKLQSNIPHRVVSSTNPVPRPTGYIDPEVILATGFAKTVEEILEEAPAGIIVPLSYAEGFPTINGLPFWERLDGEAMHFYEWFKAYRDMLSEPARKASANNLHLVPGRSIREVAARVNQQPTMLHAISICYHWGLRIQAYDDYRSELIRQTRLSLSLQMESEHQEAARKLFEICRDYMLTNKDKLTPTTALKWMEMSARLERLSLGYHPDRPATGDDDVSARNVFNITQNTLNNLGGPAPALGALQAGQGASEMRSRVSEILGILYRSGAVPADRLAALIPQKDEPEVVDVILDEEDAAVEEETTVEEEVYDDLEL